MDSGSRAWYDIHGAHRSARVPGSGSGKFPGARAGVAHQLQRTHCGYYGGALGEPCAADPSLPVGSSERFRGCCRSAAKGPLVQAGLVGAFAPPRSDHVGRAHHILVVAFPRTETWRIRRRAEGWYRALAPKRRCMPKSATRRARRMYDRAGAASVMRPSALAKLHIRVRGRRLSGLRSLRDVWGQPRCTRGTCRRCAIS